MSQWGPTKALESIFANELQRRAREGDTGSALALPGGGGTTIREILEGNPVPDYVTFSATDKEAVALFRLMDAIDGCDEKNVIDEIERLAAEGGA